MIRDCPFCGTKPKPTGDGVIITKEVMLDAGGGEVSMSHTVRCCECGAAVSEEHFEEVVARWNGGPMPWDDISDDPDGSAP